MQRNFSIIVKLSLNAMALIIIYSNIITQIIAQERKRLIVGGPQFFDNQNNNQENNRLDKILGSFRDVVAIVPK